MRAGIGSHVVKGMGLALTTLALLVSALSGQRPQRPRPDLDARTVLRNAIEAVGRHPHAVLDGPDKLLEVFDLWGGHPAAIAAEVIRVMGDEGASPGAREAAAVAGGQWVGIGDAGTSCFPEQAGPMREALESLRNSKAPRLGPVAAIALLYAGDERPALFRDLVAALATSHADIGEKLLDTVGDVARIPALRAAFLAAMDARIPSPGRAAVLSALAGQRLGREPDNAQLAPGLETEWPWLSRACSKSLEDRITPEDLYFGRAPRALWSQRLATAADPFEASRLLAVGTLRDQLAVVEWIGSWGKTERQGSKCRALAEAAAHSRFRVARLAALETLRSLPKAELTHEPDRIRAAADAAMQGAPELWQAAALVLKRAEHEIPPSHRVLTRRAGPPRPRTDGPDYFAGPAPTEQDVPLLHRMLMAQSGLTRRFAIRLLARVEPAAASLKALLSALETETSGVNFEEARQALLFARAAPTTAEPQHRLVSWMHGDDPNLWPVAHELLTQSNTVNLANTPAPRRAAAAMMAGEVIEHRGPDTTKELLYALRHGLWFTRVAAVEALAQCAQPTRDALDAVLRALRHDRESGLNQAEVRAAAAKTLGTWGLPIPRAEPALLAAMQEDSTSDVPPAAATALARLFPGHRDRCVAFLLDCDADSTLALRALLKIGKPDQRIGFLEQFKDDADVQAVIGGLLELTPAAGSALRELARRCLTRASRLEISERIEAFHRMAQLPLPAEEFILHLGRTYFSMNGPGSELAPYSQYEAARRGKILDAVDRFGTASREAQLLLLRIDAIDAYQDKARLEGALLAHPTALVNTYLLLSLGPLPAFWNKLSPGRFEAELATRFVANLQGSRRIFEPPRPLQGPLFPALLLAERVSVLLAAAHLEVPDAVTCIDELLAAKTARARLLAEDILRSARIDTHVDPALCKRLVAHSEQLPDLTVTERLRLVLGIARVYGPDSRLHERLRAAFFGALTTSTGTGPDYLNALPNLAADHPTTLADLLALLPKTRHAALVELSVRRLADQLAEAGNRAELERARADAGRLEPTVEWPDRLLEIAVRMPIDDALKRLPVADERRWLERLWDDPVLRALLVVLLLVPLAMLLSNALPTALGQWGYAGFVAVAVGSSAAFESLALHAGWTLAWSAVVFAAVVLVGAVSSTAFRAMVQHKPFDSAGALLLTLPPVRRRLYRGYVTRCRRRIGSDREHRFRERYRNLPARQVGPSLDDDEPMVCVTAEPAAAVLTALDTAHVLVQTEGGRGKSALLREVANRALIRFEATGRGAIPVWCRVDGGSLLAQAARELGPHAFSAALLRQELARGALLLLVDDLQEAASMPDDLSRVLTGEVGGRALLAARPRGHRWTELMGQAHAWSLFEPLRLDGSTLQSFVANYRDTPLQPSELAGLERACRAADGTYLPILVRLALWVGAGELDSVARTADLYERAFRSLVGSDQDPLFDWLCEHCVATHWKTGLRALPSDGAAEEIERLKQLTSAGVLIPGDDPQRRTLRFLHDSMLSYATARGLLLGPNNDAADLQACLVRAAGDPLFFESTSGGSELFSMCLDVLSTRWRLENLLRPTLERWADEHHHHLNRQDVLGALSSGRAEAVATACRRFDDAGPLLHEAARTASRDELQALFGSLAPKVWRLLHQQPTAQFAPGSTTFHREGCQHARPAKLLSLTNVQQLGLAPCKRCCPDLAS